MTKMIQTWYAIMIENDMVMLAEHHLHYHRDMLAGTTLYKDMLAGNTHYQNVLTITSAITGMCWSPPSELSQGYSGWNQTLSQGCTGWYHTSRSVLATTGNIAGMC